MRRTALVDPSGGDHHHYETSENEHRSLERRIGKNHSNPAANSNHGACRLTMFRILALLVVLFLVLTFYSATHLSDVEKTASFLGDSRFVRVHANLDGPLITNVNDGAEEPAKNNKRTSSSWVFSQAEKVQHHFLRTTGRRSPQFMAYVEPPFANDTAALPLRTQGPDDLYSFIYPQVNGCSNLQAMLPTFHSIELDHVFGSNVFHKKSLFDLRFDYAKHVCPVDADPFLPWIHDIFPSNEGYVEFIAHNKRKCNTDPNLFQDDLRNLEPQVAIMQPVPIQRVSDSEARSIAPELWHDKSLEAITRYRLVSHEDADGDGRETRFICRFHAFALDEDSTLLKVVLGETLSAFPYNYEFANYKKPGSKPMLTPLIKGKDEQIWNSVLHFRCPIPEDLKSLIASGRSVVHDVASVYLDLVPIRTRPRTTREGYIPGVKTDFDPSIEWGGKGGILPLVDASGRYTNIPVCRPPIVDVESASGDDQEQSSVVKAQKNKRMRQHPEQGGESKSPRHYLIGCLWASASFTTRGNGVADTSTSDRLLEWLAYHLYVAKFDHIYVYDNTGAFTNWTSLAAVTNLFPSNRVSRIPWPHRVCNNNRPMHPNPGERSSQYAAEASCRVRYGPHANWLAGFDADEYLIPQGKWTDLQHWLKHGVGNNTHILSFFQTRAHPIADLMVPFADGRKCGRSVEEAKCLAKRPEKTFMETYDCESEPLPKPDFGWRAKKQIIRPWYVLNHYVHYSVVTKRLIDAPSEVSPRFVEKFPYERRVDEVEEAFMLHTKTLSPESTVGWKEKCAKNESSCPVGIPWPLNNSQTKPRLFNGDNLKYNCYRHEQVTAVLSKLKPLMEPLLERYNHGAHDALLA